MIRRFAPLATATQERVMGESEQTRLIFILPSSSSLGLAQRVSFQLAMTSTGIQQRPVVSPDNVEVTVSVMESLPCSVCNSNTRLLSRPKDGVHAL